MATLPSIPFTMTAPTWEMPPQDYALPVCGIDLWRLPLDIEGSRLETFEAWLDSAESARSSRFLSAEKRHRWIAAHGQMRLILGRYVDVAPDAVVFDYPESGKPEVAEPNRTLKTHFNLSHSDGMALLAVSRFEVGVDIEHIRTGKDVIRLGRAVLTARDLDLLRRLPATRRALLFYMHWTLRETFAKARGEGVASLLRNPTPMAVHGSFVRMEEPLSTDAQTWFARLLMPDSGYVGAVAARGCNWEVRCYQAAGWRE